MVRYKLCLKNIMWNLVHAIKFWFLSSLHNLTLENFGHRRIHSAVESMKLKGSLSWTEILVETERQTRELRSVPDLIVWLWTLSNSFTLDVAPMT